MLRLVKMLPVCGTNPTPFPTIACAGRPVTSSASRVTLPLSKTMRPAIAFRSVDLPAPFGPTIVTISPGATSTETPCTIGRPRT